VLRFTIPDSIIKEKANNHHILLQKLHSSPYQFSSTATLGSDRPLHQEEDGSLYLGQWADEEKHGRGTWLRKLPTGNCYVYEGSWDRGKRHGLGRVIVNNGGSYEGEWQEDQKHGKGVFTFPPGDEMLRYEGDFKDGWLTGQGKMFY
jgi:hypothetical protein